jgi:ABC-type bacteriocin/lantibiotic exporter with double-glycine peptidase domain
MTAFWFGLLTTLVISGEDMRFTAINKQGLDTSCGIAVTASVLNIYWGIPVNESNLYQAMVFDTAQERELTYSISFQTMMNYLNQHGIASRGYKMDWKTLKDTLEKDYAPIIINYDKPTPHFALLLHIEDGYACVADPAKGLELVDKREFEKNYSGNALLTASVQIQKNSRYIEQVIDRERKKLNTLQDMATSRKIRGR